MNHIFNFQNPFTIDRLKDQIKTLKRASYIIQSVNFGEVSNLIGSDFTSHKINMAVLVLQGELDAEYKKRRIVRAYRAQNNNESWNVFIALNKQFSEELKLIFAGGKEDLNYYLAQLYNSLGFDAGRYCGGVGRAFSNPMYWYFVGGKIVMRQYGGLDI